MIATENLIWVDFNHNPKSPKPPKAALEWLDSKGSLTAKLKNKYPDFGVKVLSQCKQTPHLHEIKVLDFTDAAIIRKTALLGNNQAVVFARSVIPITNDTESLLMIENKPLGEVLFNNKNVQKNTPQITNIGDIWGRRSVFVIGKTKLLVSEFFLTELYA